MQNTAKQDYLGLVAFYDTQTRKEVGLFSHLGGIRNRNWKVTHWKTHPNKNAVIPPTSTGASQTVDKRHDCLADVGQMCYIQ